MEKLKLTKKDSHIVSCVIEVPQDPKGIVIAVHGFSSSKEGTTYQMLMKRLPSAGYGVLALDLPGHGVEESAQELLRVSGALDSIETAEAYVSEHYPEIPICYFASSFGAWLTCLYISLRDHKGRHVFLRSAAVNMPELFLKKELTEEERKHIDDLETKGYFDTNMDLHAPVRITKEMFEDFEKTDLFRLFDPEKFGYHEMLMVHGEDDTVIDPEAAIRFAEEFTIPLIMVPEEGHSLCDHPGTADRVIDLAIELYDIRGKRPELEGIDPAVLENVWQLGDLAMEYEVAVIPFSSGDYLEEFYRFYKVFNRDHKLVPASDSYYEELKELKTYDGWREIIGQTKTFFGIPNCIKVFEDAAALTEELEGPLGLAPLFFVDDLLFCEYDDLTLCFISGTNN